MDKADFEKYNYEIENNEFEIRANKTKADDLYVRNRIKEILGGNDPHKLGELSKEKRNKIIINLKNKEGLL